jgi:RNA polymerase sigma factor (sigma-70 family)
MINTMNIENGSTQENHKDRQQKYLGQWLDDHDTEIRSALRPIAYKLCTCRGTQIDETLTDLQSEVTCRLLEKAEIYDPTRSPIGLIMRFAQNIALRWQDEAKIARKRNTVLPDDLEVSDNGRTVSNMEATVLTEHILRKLSPNDRQIIELYHMQEYSADEVASLTGMSSANVRVRYHRLLKTLKAQYAEEKA